MTKVEAEFYASEISRKGRKAYTEQVVKRHSNGYAVAVARASDPEPQRLMHIEQAAAFVAHLDSKAAAR